MKIKTSHKAIAALLILVFGTFTVGIPVVKYLCPFMSSANPVCPMATEHTNGPAFTFEKPSCCGSYIIAERSTTPYLHVEKYNTPSTDIVNHFIASDFHPFQAIVINTVVPANTSPPPGEEIPLFVLNSALLI